jgi:predicted transcriptional regulator
MKKIILVLISVLFLISSPVLAEELEVGVKASDWSFKDSEKKEFTMESWAGKVLLVTYVDPDESDLNEHFTDAMKKAKDDGRLNSENYKGIGIADCAATWKPNFAIRAIAGKKAKKYKTVILFDYKATLRTAWGLKKDTSNVIILDKNRVCRAIVRGRVPDDQVAALVQLAVDLQSK